jgi:hypothetical protein
LAAVGLGEYARATFLDGIQLSEAITGDGTAIFAIPVGWGSKHRLEADRVALRQRSNAGLVEVEEPHFQRI